MCGDLPLGVCVGIAPPQQSTARLPISSTLMGRPFSVVHIVLAYGAADPRFESGAMPGVVPWVATISTF